MLIHTERGIRLSLPLIAVGINAMFIYLKQIKKREGHDLFSP